MSFPLEDHFAVITFARDSPPNSGIILVGVSGVPAGVMTNVSFLLPTSRTLNTEGEIRGGPGSGVSMGSW